MDYTNYVAPEILVLIPVLCGVGKVLKDTEKIPDSRIPLILTVIGIALTALYVMGTNGISPVSIFTSFVQGILVAAVSVYGNQIFKQSKK